MVQTSVNLKSVHLHHSISEPKNTWPSAFTIAGIKKFGKFAVANDFDTIEATRILCGASMKLKRYVLGNFKLHQGHFPACETTVVSCTSVRSMVCSAASFEAHNLMPWNSFVSRGSWFTLFTVVIFENLNFASNLKRSAFKFSLYSVVYAYLHLER